MAHTEPKYRTFDELLADVEADLPTLSNEALIEPAQLIKVAQRVSYELGHRIHSPKQTVLCLEKGRAKLPDDLYVLNGALVCGSYTVSHDVPSGRHTENMILSPSDCRKCGQPDPECTCEKTYTVECQNGEQIFVQVVEKRRRETRRYTTFARINLVPSRWVVKDCPTNHASATHRGEVRGGWIYTDLDEGDLYIHYLGALEDEDGNLLVLDHPLVNEYYEYALKQRILENLLLMGEEVAQKLQLIETRLRAARNNALSLVNTPDFREMRQLWEMNRRAQYHRYYDMFRSFPVL